MATEAAARAIGGALQSDDSKKKEGERVEPKEFFWDQFLTYLSGAILALSALNVSVEFLRGGGVSCFPPSVHRDEGDPDFGSGGLLLSGSISMLYELNRAQSDYVNSYCAQNVPYTEYFPIYIIVHGILLVAPHYIWNAIFKSDFDSFFAIIEKLDRLRDFTTGEFDPKNVDRVKKLEIEYGRNKRQIFTSYILKLVLQLIIAIGSILFSILYFKDFNFTFNCPEDFNPGIDPSTAEDTNWPFNTTVPCVYTSLRLLALIRYADHLLNGLASVLIVVGIAWCFIRHVKELGAKDVAHFVFYSCLTPDTFSFPHWAKLRWLSYHLLCKYCCLCVPDPSNLKHLFHPRIRNDLDFLLMRLFRADSSHGRVFRDIQVEKELSVLRGRDHQLLHLFINVQQEMRILQEEEQDNRGSDETDGTFRERIQDLREFFRDSGFNSNPEEHAFYSFQGYLGNTQWEHVDGIRDAIYGFVQFGPKESESGRPRNDLAIDISFGSIGYSLVLSRPFKQVVSLNFHPFYRNAEKVCHDEQFYTNYATIKFPDNIFTQPRESHNKASGIMSSIISDQRADFIIVGPIKDEAKKVTVNLLIELLNTGEQIAKEAILLAIRPLRVADKDLTDRFCQYKPPEKLFDHTFHSRYVLGKLAELGEESVGDITGVSVPCDDIPCVFEFITYRFCGTCRDRGNGTKQPDSGFFSATPSNAVATQEASSPHPLETRPAGTRQASSPHPLETRPAGTRQALETRPAGTRQALETRPAGTQQALETRPAGTRQALETRPAGTRQARPPDNNTSVSDLESQHVMELSQEDQERLLRIQSLHQRRIGGSLAGASQQRQRRAQPNSVTGLTTNAASHEEPAVTRTYDSTPATAMPVTNGHVSSPQHGGISSPLDSVPETANAPIADGLVEDMTSTVDSIMSRNGETGQSVSSIVTNGQFERDPHNSVSAGHPQCESTAARDSVSFVNGSLCDSLLSPAEADQTADSNRLTTATQRVGWESPTQPTVTSV